MMDYFSSKKEDTLLMKRLYSCIWPPNTNETTSIPIQVEGDNHFQNLAKPKKPSLTLIRPGSSKKEPRNLKALQLKKV